MNVHLASVTLRASWLSLSLAGGACDYGQETDLSDGYSGIGCEGSGPLAQPFGSHAFRYAKGSILPTRESASSMDRATANTYDAWKQAHLRQGCGEGRYYVAANVRDGLTVSEAHGYGMIITVFMAGHDPEARSIFDGMLLYFQDHPSEISPNLMAWYQDSSCQNAEGSASASDGDLDIAYALLLADKQWGSDGDVDYGAEAAKVLAAIKARELHPSGHMLLGDWVSPEDPVFYNATRSSDFMPGHFAAFGAATGDAHWAEAVATGYDLFSHVQTTGSPVTGLLPDFIVDVNKTPQAPSGVLLEASTDGSYGHNACRVPWRVGVHFLMTGDARAAATLQPLNAWVRRSTSEDPQGVKPGYKLSGAPATGGEYVSLAFVAPLGVGAMVDTENQTWLNQLWALTRARSTEGQYYEDSLSLLSMIAMSGNWWSPESTPCPRSG